MPHVPQNHMQHGKRYNELAASFDPKQAYSPEEKIRLIELLWQIAYANESLHKYEEHLVRKIADLLHVPHKAYIAAKFRANES